MIKGDTGRKQNIREKKYFGTPITIRTHRYGSIKLRWLAVGDLEFLTFV
jgi:hypothetical protein